MGIRPKVREVDLNEALSSQDMSWVDSRGFGNKAVLLHRFAKKESNFYNGLIGPVC